MSMDKTTEIQLRLAMAKTLYMGLNGVDVDNKTKNMAARYSQNFIKMPWKDSSDASSNAYGMRFFNSLKEIGSSTHLVSSWQHIFDEHYSAKNADLAKKFISDYFRTQQHQPITHHDFSCYQKIIPENGIFDFPLQHPISVDFWAVYFCSEGEGTLGYADTEITLSTKSVVVVPPGVPCVLARNKSSALWKCDCLTFRSQLNWIELLDWAIELTKPIYFEALNAQHLSPLIQQIRQLEKTTYRPGTLSDRLYKNIIENILIRLRIIAEDKGGIPTKINPKVQRVVDYILKYYDQEITLARIASHVNLSPSRLSALFKEQFGIGIVKWRDHIRMQKAKELLKSNDVLVSEVAELVGYTDALYFSRRFKQHFGFAPSDASNKY